MLYLQKTKGFSGVLSGYEITLARNKLSLFATVIFSKELWSISEFLGRVGRGLSCWERIDGFFIFRVDVKLKKISLDAIRDTAI